MLIKRNPYLVELNKGFVVSEKKYCCSQSEAISA